jgi:hypothetical protein
VTSMVRLVAICNRPPPGGFFYGSSTVPNQFAGLLEAAIAALAKLMPGILGALIALRFHQETSFWGRMFVLICSVILSTALGPAINEALEILTPQRQAAVHFLVGLFGLFVVSEVIKAIKEIGLAEIARDLLRKVLGIGRKGG